MLWYTPPMIEPTFPLPSRMRGIYGRVARRLRVHPSYVSRVARGERTSAKISAALNREVKNLLISAFRKRKTKKK